MAEDSGILLRYRQCPSLRVSQPAATLPRLRIHLSLFLVPTSVPVTPRPVHGPRTTTPIVATSSHRGPVRMHCRCSARMSLFQMRRDGAGSNYHASSRKSQMSPRKSWKFGNDIGRACTAAVDTLHTRHWFWPCGKKKPNHSFSDLYEILSVHHVKKSRVNVFTKWQFSEALRHPTDCLKHNIFFDR